MVIILSVRFITDESKENFIHRHLHQQTHTVLTGLSYELAHYHIEGATMLAG